MQLPKQYCVNVEAILCKMLTQYRVNIEKILRQYSVNIESLTDLILDMEFLEVLTEGLERVLMVRGGGREVITIYS